MRSKPYDRSRRSEAAKKAWTPERHAAISRRGSRYQRALVELGEAGFMTVQEFTRRLAKVCETKEQIVTLKSDLVRRGAVTVGVLVVEKT